MDLSLPQVPLLFPSQFRINRKNYYPLIRGCHSVHPYRTRVLIKTSDHSLEELLLQVFFENLAGTLRRPGD